MLGKAVNPGLRDRLEVGPFSRGGDSFTVNNTGTEDEQTVGASFRFVADPSDWGRCLGVNTPGQSGDPADPHYPTWRGCGPAASIFQSCIPARKSPRS